MKLLTEEELQEVRIGTVGQLIKLLDMYKPTKIPVFVNNLLGDKYGIDTDYELHTIENENKHYGMLEEKPNYALAKTLPYSKGEPLPNVKLLKEYLEKVMYTNGIDENTSVVFEEKGNFLQIVTVKNIKETPVFILF